MSTAIHQWLSGNDTGASSKAIALTALGQMPRRPEHPRDAADFGRCLRLLKAAPEAKAGLDELGVRGGPYWIALVARWGELELAAWYDEGEPKRDGVYTLIRGILQPIEASDLAYIQLAPGISMRLGR